MKKTAAIFFLLFLFISQIGHILLYCVQLRHFKDLAQKEIMAGMQLGFCEIIEDDAAIHWENAGQEFSKNGEWYDVVAIKKSRGKTFLYCLNDRNEARLVKAFASLIASSSANGKSDHTVVKFHVTDQYIILTETVLACIPQVKHYHESHSPCLCCTYAESLVPPPRC